MAMKYHPSDGHVTRRTGAGARTHEQHRHADLDVGTDGTDLVARLLHGFADPGRLRILEHLRLGEHRVVELTAHLGLAQSTVSAHLACLRDCGLLDVRHEGRSSYYRLAHPEATEALLRASSLLLDRTVGGTPGPDATEPTGAA